MGTKIDCEKYYKVVIENITNQVNTGIINYGRRPRLVVITIGKDKASEVYIKGKIKDCELTGIEITHMKFSENVTQSDIENELSLIKQYDGIMIQLPIPLHLSMKKLIADKNDVDGFKLTSKFIPCTPLGIIRLLKYNYIDISGKHVVVIGRSKTVGRPLANILIDMDATVTICHSKTLRLAKFTRKADLIISCTGQINLVTPDMIKEGGILIDVGINRDENNKVCGDISKECYNKAHQYTTVPNGIGLVTRATLLENVMMAYWLNIKH